MNTNPEDSKIDTFTARSILTKDSPFKNALEEIVLAFGETPQNKTKDLEIQCGELFDQARYIKWSIVRKELKSRIDNLDTILIAKGFKSINKHTGNEMFDLNFKPLVEGDRKNSDMNPVIKGFFEIMDDDTQGKFFDIWEEKKFDTKVLFDRVDIVDLLGANGSIPDLSLIADKIENTITNIKQIITETAERITELEKLESEEQEIAEKIKSDLLEAEKLLKQELNESKRKKNEPKILRSLFNPEKLLVDDHKTNLEYRADNKKILTEFIFLARDIKANLIKIYSHELEYRETHGHGGIIVTNFESELGLYDNGTYISDLLEKFKNYSQHVKSQSWLADSDYSRLFKEAIGAPITDISTNSSKLIWRQLRVQMRRFNELLCELIEANQKLLHGICERHLRSGLGSNFVEFQKSKKVSAISNDKFIGNTKLTYNEILNSSNLDILFAALTMRNTITQEGEIVFPNEFSTWLYASPRDISRLIRDESNTIRIPAHTIDIIRQYKKLVEQKYSEEEIATMMEMTIEKLRFLKRVITINPPISIDRLRVRMPSVYDGSRNMDKFVAWYDFFDPNKYTEQSLNYQQEHLLDPSHSVELKLLREDLESVLKTLSPRERDVLNLRYGMDDGRMKTHEEIGQIFELSKTRISQIEAGALRKLRHPNRNSVLKEYIR